MIRVTIENNKLSVKGHANSQLCGNISCLTQYICSCLELEEFNSTIGSLEAKFKDNAHSRFLITKFIKFIKKLKTPEIYLEVRGN